MSRFLDRAEAGRVLAEALTEYRGREDLLVMALPRGGVPVAFEVAKALDAPLDVMIVRKLGYPGQPELAMGAIASGGALTLNPAIAELVPEAVQREVVAREREEIARREAIYRGDRPAPNVEDRCVILVDDGLATGATMRAAVIGIRTYGPKAIVVAVPVAPPSTIHALRREADRVVCPTTPPYFAAIGLWYEDFHQVSDDEVLELLDRARAREPSRRVRGAELDEKHPR
jgi:putative phosphoribosyl transferase